MGNVLTGPSVTLLAICALVFPGAGAAQESSPASVHWAYSAYFGTGWYSVDGDRDVFIFRVTPRWDLVEPSYEDGERKLGWFLKVPISAGLDRFDTEDVLEAVDLDNVTFLSVNPTIDLEVPINKIWSLRPYASMGYGQVINSSESAWSYWGGIKSRVILHSDERSSWSLINHVGYVGYTPNEGPSDSFWPLMAGFEASHPFGKAASDSSQWLIHWHATYTYFGNDIFFSRSPTTSTDINDQWELGAAVGKRDARIKIWLVSFDRLGLGLRSSSDGSLTGITFIFRSEFDK
jgi:hypothetical protein